MNNGYVIALVLASVMLAWVASQGGASVEPASPNAKRAHHRQASEVTLARASDGHFYADADINGASLHVLADTGASVVVLGQADAERAGLDPDRLDYSIPVSTANGEAWAAKVTIDEVRVGSIVRRDVDGVVVKNLNGSLLGMSFFNTLSEVAIVSDELVLKD